MSTIKNCYTLKKLNFWLLLVMLLWVSSNLLHAQISGFEVKKVFEHSIFIQKTGMIVLGSWATLNIISGIAGTIYYKNDLQYFYQMNTAWNTVNLGIAALGFLGATNTDLSIGINEMIGEMKNFDRILIINAALD